MSEQGYIGIWRKVLPIGEFKFGVRIVHVHASGRAATITYSFRPFHDLDSCGAVFGRWKPLEGPRAVMKLDGDDDDLHLLYIPDRQLEVRFGAGREIYERAAARDISVTHLNLISGIDFNEQIYSYLESGVLPPMREG